MSEFEILLRHYGYVFILVGSLAEGETTVVLGGLAAHRGYLNLALVVVVATFGASVGDQIWFHVGRARGRTFLESRPTWRPAVDRFEALLEKWDTAIILVFRFLYGMRLVGAVAMGTSSISTLKFSLLNLVGAAIWASLVACGGYVLGNTMQRILGDVVSYEEWIFAALLATGAGVAIWHARRRRRATTA